MSDKVFLRNVKTNKRFEIIRVDKVKNEIVLKGEYSTFTEPYNIQRFKDNGYVIEKGEQDAQQP